MFYSEVDVSLKLSLKIDLQAASLLIDCGCSP